MSKYSAERKIVACKDYLEGNGSFANFTAKYNIRGNDTVHQWVFYSEERPQGRYHCKTPLEVRNEAMPSKSPTVYPIAENRRIQKYKAKWVA